MNCNMDLTSLIGVPPFDYTLYAENCGQEWENWLISFEWYAKANHIEDDNDKFVKLLHLTGRKVQELYKTLKDDKIEIVGGPFIHKFVPNPTKYERAVAKLNEFFLPKTNKTYERHIFRKLRQEKGERISCFVTRLRKQAERCGFGDAIEENIKDQIIETCQSVKLRHELLKVGDRDLNKILKVAKVFEAISEQEKSFENKSSLGFGFENKRSLSFGNNGSLDVHSIQSNFRKKEFVHKSIKCTRCGYSGHPSFDDKCPAKGKRCNTCGGHDHFSRKCFTKKRSLIEEYPLDGNRHRSIEETSSGGKKRKLEEEVVKFISESTTDGYEF